MNHKELTKHLRGRLAHAGVPCRVRMNEYCGHRVVQIITPTYDKRWNAEQLAQIALIARCNHLTMAQGLPVHDDAIMRQLTSATQFDFEVPA